MNRRSLIYTTFLSALTLSQATLSKADNDTFLASLAGTMSVRSQPQLQNGKLVGCQLVYDALIQDWTYRQGQFLKVSGAVGIMGLDKGIGTILKVVVLEIGSAQSDAVAFKPAPPSRAFLVADDYTTSQSSLVSASESDTPGALFSVFYPEPTLQIVFKALETNRLVVAFNKKGGESDILLPLELDVENMNETGVRSRSPKAGTEFAQCVLALTNDIKE